MKHFPPFQIMFWIQNCFSVLFQNFEIDFFFIPASGNKVPALSLSEATEEIKRAERFTAELSEIARNKSKWYLLKEIMDSFEDFVVNCTYFGRSCFNPE